MKLFKSLLVVLMVLANLAFAQPSFADRPKFINNPDYIEVTKAINELTQAQNSPTPVEGTTPEETQKKIDELAFQKYALETGINWGQCLNQTGKTLAIYGKKPKKENNLNSPYDNGLYFLADGQSTKAKWDCDGFYLPNDAKIADLRIDGQAQEFTGPVAVKIPDGSQLAIKTNPETGAIEVNVPNSKIVQGNEANWFIPNVSQALIDTRVPNAPSKKS
ncbi:hypothetical protein [Calothrix sp. PCC 7507]|uniref:hypothetical protein n=1 Tax=Calothrix sp. PCC 7507 TaxID=99598 RepID=UPI00029EF86A|nr:hypothetical protein [Calothrix sp. PCC 7507]AFY31413.1 hypothetical protein Cal7507_0934 [Calothrix sp. PCC 7507]